MQSLSFRDFYALVWSLVPNVWKEADDEYGKSLQVLLYTMSQHMYYYFYERVVHMEELFDPDVCPEKYLKFLAGMVGWKLVGQDAASWREQIKAAPLLYKLRGTKRGIMLAEKLVGYSIFMSELYRDHVGDAVPKERIFNNTPDSIKQKPWFRTSLNSIEGEVLYGQAESDQFESFNKTKLVKLDSYGRVIRPRVVSNNRKLVFTKSSTTTRYNNLTGAYSRARYARLPRLNVVLKYEYDLDAENADGSIKANNFTGALDLLLQFKPFHVFIENLEVRYSLEEFILDQTNLSSETLNVHEQTELAAYLELDRAEHTIAFSPVSATEMPTSITYSPVDNNKGVIYSNYSTINLATVTPILETQIENIISKGFPTKSEPAKLITDVISSVDSISATISEKVLRTKQKFIDTYKNIIGINVTLGTVVNSPVYTGFLGNSGVAVLGCTSGSTPELLDTTHYKVTEWYKNNVLFYTDAVSTYTSTLDISSDLSASYHSKVIVKRTSDNAIISTATIDMSEITPIPVHNVLTYNITNALTKPVLDFKAMLSTQAGATSLAQFTTPISDGFDKIIVDDYTVGLDNSHIIAVTPSTTPFRASVQTSLGTQHFVTPTSIDPTPVSSNPWDLAALTQFRTNILSATTLSSLSNLQVFRQLYDYKLMIVLDTIVSSAHVYTVLDPKIDYYFDNTGNISLNSLTIAEKFTVPFTSYDFLSSSTLHILYLTRESYKNETELGIQVRGFRYTDRKNTKFSRQFAINSLPDDSMDRLTGKEIISVNGKTKEKTSLGIKQFKTTMPIYNRSSLKSEVIDGYPVVTKHPLNRIDKSKWTVYSPEFTAYYLGDQKITNNWWGNFYQAKFPTAQEPYADVDTSRATQAELPYSDQWVAALKLYNIEDPKQFLVSRQSNDSRIGIWKRNSCKLVSIPFMRSRRDIMQVFRKDIPTFTRSEESTDYLIDASVPIRTDNYKYVFKDGTDVSLSYFNPGFSQTDLVHAIPERAIGEKATISTTGYTLTTAASDTYYDNFTSNNENTSYFVKNSNIEYSIKPSLYAGNIPINKDPSTSGNINDGLDKLDLKITGLAIAVDEFSVSSVVNEFILSHTNVFISWITPDTGEVVNFGPYPYHPGAVPDIKVFLNGVLLKFGTGTVTDANRYAWTISFDVVKSITIIQPISIGDSVRVEYQIIPGQQDVVYTPPVPQVLQTLNITLTVADIFGTVSPRVYGIREGNRYIFDIPTACVSWYNKLDGQFISYGTEPVQYQPFAMYENAEPNMLIWINGIKISYKKDWTFLLRMDGVTITAAIAISPEVSLSLTEGDTIRLEYFTTT